MNIFVVCERCCECFGRFGDLYISFLGSLRFIEDFFLGSFGSFMGIFVKLFVSVGILINLCWFFSVLWGFFFAYFEWLLDFWGISKIFMGFF